MPGRGFYTSKGGSRYSSRAFRRAIKLRHYNRTKAFSRRHRGKGAYATRYFKIRDGPKDVTSDGTGLYVNQWTDDPQLYTDFPNISALFDSYRVAAIKVQYTPSRPNELVASTAWEPIYVCGDPDNSTASTTITTNDAVIQYENSRVKNLYTPWTYYFRIPKRTSIRKSDGTAGTVSAGGYIDLADVGAYGAIMYRATGLTASTKYGTIVGTCYIKVKNRR